MSTDDSQYRLVIPLEGEEHLPWDYFVLEAARGGVKVPTWVLKAVRCAVATRLCLTLEAVDGEHIDQVIKELPPSPRPLLLQLLSHLNLAVPQLGVDSCRLRSDQAIGSFRDSVGSPDLLWDAALAVQDEYGADGFYNNFEQALKGKEWDAVAAVASMIYLLLVRDV